MTDFGRMTLWSTARWIRQELEGGRCPASTVEQSLMLARFMERAANGSMAARVALSAMGPEFRSLLGLTIAPSQLLCGCVRRH